MAFFVDLGEFVYPWAHLVFVGGLRGLGAIARCVDRIFDSNYHLGDMPIAFVRQTPPKSSHEKPPMDRYVDRTFWIDSRLGFCPVF